PPTGDTLLFHSHPLTSSILTAPLGLALGAVAGTNLMIVLMVLFGAWAFYLYVRAAFDIGFLPAFVAGAAFGFSPYFMMRAHWHVNMLGACFWAPALGVLIWSYVKGRFDLRYGIVYALFFWATFWNSFVEVFMLALVSGIAVALLELQRLVECRDAPHWLAAYRKRLTYFLPTIAGSVSLLVFAGGPRFETIYMPLWDCNGFKDLFLFPRLSIFSGLVMPERFANWGICVPYSLWFCAAAGVLYVLRARLRHFWPMLVAMVVVVIISCDPGHLASGLVRKLPLGEGFRVFTRFHPFFLFFLVTFGALGMARIGRAPALPEGGYVSFPTVRHVAIFGLIIAGLVEFYPAGMNLRPIKQLPITPELHETLSNGQFCLVVPEKYFVQLHNTYQVALDMPCVQMTFWDKMNQESRAFRTHRFPCVYPKTRDYPGKPLIEDPRIRQELRDLNVGFVLFENKYDAQRAAFRGTPLLETDRELLIQVNE
ncbi:MAG: hypothetical protein QG656_2636, partial [Candidatus Hydrogenedentes bacterium]|nr:hypothetical protein [Candidatus Hydrogenedentota bacterium]